MVQAVYTQTRDVAQIKYIRRRGKRVEMFAVATATMKPQAWVPTL
jgi:hypothetical protein